MPPWQWLVGFGYHAILFSFLMTASVCDLKSREIPLPLTLTGSFWRVGCCWACALCNKPQLQNAMPAAAPRSSPGVAVDFRTSRGDRCSSTA